MQPNRPLKAVAVLRYEVEQREGTARARKWRPVIAKMLDRVVESANADCMLFNEVNAATLKPIDTRLLGKWGYVYGAVYSFIHAPAKRSTATLAGACSLICRSTAIMFGRGKAHLRCRTDRSMPADGIESATYLVAREPVPEAPESMESEMKVILLCRSPTAMSRTSMVRQLQPHRPSVCPHEEPGCWARTLGARRCVGAVRDGETLYLSLDMPSSRRIRFDSARHNRILKSRSELCPPDRVSGVVWCGRQQAL
jgi:hypothetical protein